MFARPIVTQCRAPDQKWPAGLNPRNAARRVPASQFATQGEQAQKCQLIRQPRRMTMKRSMYLPLALIALAVLAGCASTPDFDYMAAEQARQARLDTVATQCETDLCRVMVAQEANRNAIRPPQQGHHPAWSIFDRALGLAIPAYFGWRQAEALTDAITGTAGVIAGMDRSDNSVHVGGNLGDTRGDEISVGGNYGDTRGDEVGRDQIGRDQRVGDDIDGSCIGADCRNVSPGPIDQSDNSDNSGGGEP